MTVYRIYSQNGCHAGFWVQHHSWQNRCARIVSVAGKLGGPLPGSSPDHDAAEVLVECFDVRSGRLISTGPLVEDRTDRHFTQIAVPSWSRPRPDPIFPAQRAAASKR